MLRRVLSRAVYLPFYEWQTGRQIRRKLREIEPNQWLAPRALRAYQEERFLQVVNHAFRRVPYYQQRFERMGLAPGDFQTLDDLKKLPFLTKEEIVQNSRLLVSRDCQGVPLEIRQTGGSTGPSMKIAYDQEALDLTAAVNIRNLEWTGKRFGDREVHITNASPVIPPLKDKLKEQIKCHFLNRVNVFVRTLGPLHLAHLLSRLRQVRPVLVQGYPTILASLAQYVQSVGARCQPLFQIAETTGETLFDWQRAVIEQSLGCRVFNRYGLAEFGIIAHECQAHTGLHINADTVIVECVNGESQAEVGKLGELVITTLTNFAMPLIRYRTGDSGTLLDTACPCGRGFPLLARLEGRIHDMICTPSGDHLYSHFFQDLMLAVGGIRRFQIIQKALASILVKLVPAEDFTPRTLVRIEDHLRAALGHGVELKFEIVEEIDVTQAGKYRYTISELR